MPEPRPIFFPPMLLMLDAIGTLLFGIGVVQFVAEINVLPASWNVEHVSEILIGAGAALMLPTVVYVIRRAKNGTPPPQS